jgi:hypothetical protein
MNCDKNLLLPPPRDLFPKYDYALTPPRADIKDLNEYKEQRHDIPSKQAKREAFMLCGLISAVNEALKYYKQEACGGNANLKQVYTVYDDPSNW